MPARHSRSYRRLTQRVATSYCGFGKALSRPRRCNVRHLLPERSHRVPSHDWCDKYVLAMRRQQYGTFELKPGQGAF